MAGPGRACRAAVVTATVAGAPMLAAGCMGATAPTAIARSQPGLPPPEPG